MSLRVKLLLLFTLAVAAAAGVTAWSSERYTAQQFQQADQARSDALAAQFRRELAEREAEVTTSVQTIADAESTTRMVLELSSAQADPSVYAGDARGLAAARDLDFLELAGQDGTLISSAQWPDRVGYKIDWVTHENDWNQRGAFLDRVELPDRMEVGILAVRMVRAGNSTLFIVGGRRLNSSFLQNLALPSGMRALLYRNLEAGFVPSSLSDGGQGSVTGAETFAPLIDSLQKEPPALEQGDSGPMVNWAPESGGAERFVALPLTGRQGEFLGALLLGSVQGQRLALQNYIGSSALVVAGLGMVLAFFISWWVAARVSQPLARLSEGLGEVAAGDWDTQVEASAAPEVRKTIGAFNKMTKHLADERAGQVARERAAAWRQLAGQLAVELKTLLPPLQKALEGVEQAQHKDALNAQHKNPLEDFDDDFEPEHSQASEQSEQTALVSAAMQHTLETLAACAGKLGEFASLPVPRLEAVTFNDVVRAVVQSYEPRFSAIGRPPITPELFLDDRVGQVRADAVLLRKALENLLLFVIEDMPAGGTFTIHTRRQDGMAHMILSGSGMGASVPRSENRAAAQDPAVRVSGIGLSLATVQSIVSSHGGKISIESSPLAGTTFYLDWPFHSSSANSVVPDLPAVLQDRPNGEPASPSASAPDSAAPEPLGPKQDDPRPAGEKAQPQYQESHSAEPAVAAAKSAPSAPEPGPASASMESYPLGDLFGNLGEDLVESLPQDALITAAPLLEKPTAEVAPAARDSDSLPQETPEADEPLQGATEWKAELQDELSLDQLREELERQIESEEETRKAALAAELQSSGAPESRLDPQQELELKALLETRLDLSWEPSEMSAPVASEPSAPLESQVDGTPEALVAEAAPAEAHEQATEPQPVVSEAAAEKPELAAVIEEVIETRGRFGRFNFFGARSSKLEVEPAEPLRDHEPVAASPIGASPVAASHVVSPSFLSEDAISEPAAPPVAPVLSLDSSPEQFGFGLLDSALPPAPQPTVAEAPSASLLARALEKLQESAAPAGSAMTAETKAAETVVAEEKSAETKADETYSAPPVEPAPEPVLQSVSGSSDSSAKKEERNVPPGNAYSPLTYRW